MKAANREIRRAYNTYFKNKSDRIAGIREEMQAEHPALFRRFN